ncbi:hypothetical protein Val02_92720 [Virgisporangium aliadipatigenens]|uniref:Uncharacterized protein n=1 Tax=Virgisporangium aliadipatigenens TaxID=741659 RepID=A0A8J3YZ50_9ACTN|nr:hypothetical protein [Virgisporangium aliadipatigenens]GIJ52386.1 hypothetical protein Val02_92720 [Virgisporangium aliadipatigenens]
MSESRGATGLAYDTDGLLYELGVRDLVGPSLDADNLVRYETLVALSFLKHTLDGVPPPLDRDDRRNMLFYLRRHRGSLSLDQLVARLEEDDRDDLDWLAANERADAVARDGHTVRLTPAGDRELDEVVRQLAGRVTPLLAGVERDRLPIVRHTCLRLHANRKAPYLQPGDPGPDREADDGGYEFDPVTRVLFAPALDAPALAACEAFAALRAAMFGAHDGLPKLGRPTVRAMFRLHQRPEGLPLTDFRGDGLDGFVEEGVQGGILHVEGDVVRLSEQAAENLDRGWRQRAEWMASVTEGVSVSQLAVLRDACWRVAAGAAG